MDNRIRIPGHEVSSTESPAHVSPPFLGVGLLHCLVLLFVGLPLQALQDPHALHPPFTADII